MMLQTKKPPTSGNVDGSRKKHEQRYSNKITKKPPYAHHLDLLRRDLIVCTGSGAWDRAKSRTWFQGRKLVLPFGNDPTAYVWSAASGYDVMIAGFNELEPIAVIAKLAGLLLAAGAELVLYVPEHGPITRIDAVRKEAA